MRPGIEWRQLRRFVVVDERDVPCWDAVIIIAVHESHSRGGGYRRVRIAADPDVPTRHKASRRRPREDSLALATHGDWSRCPQAQGVRRRQARSAPPKSSLPMCDSTRSLASTVD